MTASSTGGPGWTSISAGNGFSLAVRSDGTLLEWGDPRDPRFGYGPDIQRMIPHRVGTGTSWSIIVAGVLYSAGVQADGSLHVWDHFASRSSYDKAGLAEVQPVRIEHGPTWTTVTEIVGGILGLDGNGRAWDCWPQGHPDPHSVSPHWGDWRWQSLAPQYGGITLGVRKDGTLWSLRPLSSHEAEDIPGSGVKTRQIGPERSWQTVVADGMHALALASDDTLWAWGWNSRGHLGDGTTEYRDDPVPIMADWTWLSVATSWSHVLAIRSDGTLWAWGSNRRGQLGRAPGLEELSPVQVGSRSDWITVSAGMRHSLGQTADGVLHAWGDNQECQLGIPVLDMQVEPTPVRFLAE